MLFIQFIFLGPILLVAQLCDARPSHALRDARPGGADVLRPSAAVLALLAENRYTFKDLL